MCDRKNKHAFPYMRFLMRHNKSTLMNLAEEKTKVKEKSSVDNNHLNIILKFSSLIFKRYMR